MRYGYVGAVMAGAVLALSLKYYSVSGEWVALRTSTADFERFIVSQQTQAAVLRQQAQAQQEQLNKGSAIGDSVGPAVVRDIVSLAEKTGNSRLSDLLKRHGVQVRGTVGGAAPESGAPVSGSVPIGGARKGDKKGGEPK
jgi:hypothetical protein